MARNYSRSHVHRAYRYGWSGTVHFRNPMIQNSGLQLIQVSSTGTCTGTRVLCTCTYCTWYKNRMYRTRYKYSTVPILRTVVVVHTRRNPSRTLQAIFTIQDLSSDPRTCVERRPSMRCSRDRSINRCSILKLIVLISPMCRFM